MEFNSPLLKPGKLTLRLGTLVFSVLLFGVNISLLYLPLQKTALAEPSHAIKRSRKAPTATPKKINVNQTTLAELKTLPGIGPVIAGRVLDYRKNNPPFRKVEDLLIIKGISTDRLDRIRTRISLE